jgi:hypothetical protein
MIHGVECPNCKEEIPVKVLVEGDDIKDSLIEIDTFGCIDNGKYPEITIRLVINRKKILEHLKEIIESVNKQEVYEASLKIKEADGGRANE